MSTQWDYDTQHSGWSHLDRPVLLDFLNLKQERGTVNWARVELNPNFTVNITLYKIQMLGKANLGDFPIWLNLSSG